MDPKSYDARTARDYALVGLIFYGLVILVELGALLVRISIPEVFSARRLSRGGLLIRNPEFAPIGLGLLMIVAIFFAFWAFRIYKQIEQGKYEAARTATLILGIFGLFPPFGGILGGIFFLLCHAKLGDVLRPSQVPPATSKPAPIQE